MSIEMSYIKKTGNTSVDEDVGKKESSFTVADNITWFIPFS